MIGPDDIGEPRQGNYRTNHTPTIALAAAAILLLVLTAIIYKDNVRSDLEKEFAEKERMMMQRNGYIPAQPAQQQPLYNAQGQLVQNGQVYAQQPAYQQPQFQNQPQQAPQYQPAAQQPVQQTQFPQQPAAQNPNSSGVQASLPQPKDPEIDAMRDSLNKAREMSERTEQRYGEITKDVDAIARQTEVDASEITAELPEFLRNAVENPPGGNPEMERRLEKMRGQVVAAPSLAQVTGYDKDWGIVTFNAGSVQGVKEEQRFAIRRRDELLGWVKVDQVRTNDSIAVFVMESRNDDTSAKPEVGDDLIDFELF